MVTEETRSIYTQTKLNNPKSEKERKFANEAGCEIIPEESENEKETENEHFSVISYWDYSDELNNNFECSHAFMSKPVLSFNFGYNRTSK